MAGGAEILHRSRREKLDPRLAEHVYEGVVLSLGVAEQADQGEYAHRKPRLEVV